MSPSVNLKCSNKAETINVCANFNTIPTEKGATMNNSKRCSYVGPTFWEDRKRAMKFAVSEKPDKTVVVDFTDTLLHWLSVSVNLYAPQL